MGIQKTKLRIEFSLTSVGHGLLVMSQDFVVLVIYVGELYWRAEFVRHLWETFDN